MYAFLFIASVFCLGYYLADYRDIETKKPTTIQTSEVFCVQTAPSLRFWTSGFV
jgi:hypothetical protein